MSSSNHKSVLTNLSSNEVKEDLLNADTDDVVFNKNIYAKITGRSIVDKHEPTKEDKCYEDVMQFIHCEQELRNLIGELKGKQENLAVIKDQLENWMVRLSGGQVDSKEIDKAGESMKNQNEFAGENYQEEVVPNNEEEEFLDVNDDQEEMMEINNETEESEVMNYAESEEIKDNLLMLSDGIADNHLEIVAESSSQPE